MTDTISTDNFPEVKTDNELQAIINNFLNYDSYYVASGYIKERKDFFDKLWSKFKLYKDKNFETEIKTNFHQRSWEMYLGNLLLNNFFKIKSDREGPDFIIDNNIYIECIAITKGDSKSPNSVPEMFIAKTPKEIYAQDVPIDKMILRITQAITYKAIEQYGKRKKKKRFNEKTPFIIAINTGDLGYIQDYLGIPIIIKALFGLNNLEITQNGESRFGRRNEIKKGDTEISVNYFTNKEFDFISGILFSDNNILYYKDNKDDCVFVNNPYARNPIIKNFFGFFDQWNATINKNGIEITLVKKNNL